MVLEEETQTFLCNAEWRRGTEEGNGVTVVGFLGVRACTITLLGIAESFWVNETRRKIYLAGRSGGGEEYLKCNNTYVLYSYPSQSLQFI